MGDTGSSRSTHAHADKDGHFRRKDSAFRDWISSEPNAKFPAEKGRYVLYCNLGCPWAHRAILVRSLKSLEDIIQIVYTDFELTDNGWLFTGKNGSSDRDPLYGFVGLKQLYLKADPSYVGRYTVPTLWDRQAETIVNNESSEIIRMFYEAFDDIIPTQFRESSKGPKGLYPEHLRAEIDEMNEWVYNTVNNGVYKCGFATSQDAYDANIYPLFSSLDRLESHLAEPAACHGGPFLFGSHITEADIRLYTTMARFDAAYHTIFMCNLKTIRTDYPRLSRWLRRIYWNASNIPKGSVFKETTKPNLYRSGYTMARNRQVNAPNVQPRGPAIALDPWTEDDEAIDRGRIVALKALQDQNCIDTSGTATPTSSNPHTNIDFANMNLNNNGTRHPTSGYKEYKSNAHGKVDLTSDSRAPRTASSHEPNMGSFVTTGDDVEANGDIDPARKPLRRTTSQYEEQNARYVKAAKKAEKKAGAPFVHLAL